MNAAEELIAGARKWPRELEGNLINDLADALEAALTPIDPREVAHIECDCVPDLGPSHCHLCGERAGHPVPWTEAHPAATVLPTAEADDLKLLASLVNVDGDSEVHYIAAGRILAAGFHRTPAPKAQDGEALEAGYRAVHDAGVLTNDVHRNALIWRSVDTALRAALHIPTSVSPEGGK